MPRKGTDPSKLSKRDYLEAFNKVRDQLTRERLEMLRLHFDAPNHHITARQMAKAMGFPSWRGANTQYGKLGTLLCSHLGRKPGSDAIFVLVEFIGPDDRKNPYGECI